MFRMSLLHEGFRQVPLGRVWTRVQKTPSLPADTLRCPGAQMEEVEGWGSFAPPRSSAPRGTWAGPRPGVSTTSGVGDREKQTRAPSPPAAGAESRTGSMHLSAEIRRRDLQGREGNGKQGCREQRVDRETLRLVALGSRAPLEKRAERVPASFPASCSQHLVLPVGDLRIFRGL